MADAWNLTRLEASAPTAKAWVEAKKLADGGAFADIRPHPDYRGSWQATTTGRTGTYTTAVIALGAQFALHCNCPSQQRPCKHALGLAYHLARHPELRPETEPPPAVAPELEALLRACFANPKHNLPRLVLADYFEERNQIDRATVLRIQCEMPPPKKGEKPKVSRGMAKPLAEATKRLFAGFAPVKPKDFTMEFRRGFLALRLNPWQLQQAGAVTGTLLKLLRDGWVETLALPAYGGQVPAYVYAALRHVGVLDLTQTWLDEEGLLTAASELRPGRPDSRVRQVIVPKRSKASFARLLGDTTGKAIPVVRRQSYTDLTPEKFRTVLDTGLLNGVQHLTLGGEVGADGLERFAASSTPRQLRSLTLYNLDAEPAALRHLWGLRPTHFEELHLETVALGDAGVVDLCAGTLTPRGSLSLRNAGLTSAAAVALAGCNRFARLTRLDLNGNRIDTAGVAAVLASPQFSALEVLAANDTDTSALDLLPNLFAAPRRPSLSVEDRPVTLALHRPPNRGAQLTVICNRYDRRPLNWPGDGVCPEPLGELLIDGASLSATDWRRLRAWLTGQTLASLTLSHCELRNDDVPELLKLVAEVRPTELNLRENEIGVAGCKALADSPALATVRTLRMVGNPIRVSGALALAASAHRTNLKVFHIRQPSQTALDADERARITAAFKGARVTF